MNKFSLTINTNRCWKWNAFWTLKIFG